MAIGIGSDLGVGLGLTPILGASLHSTSDAGHSLAAHGAGALARFLLGRFLAQLSSASLVAAALDSGSVLVED